MAPPWRLLQGLAKPQLGFGKPGPNGQQACPFWRLPRVSAVTLGGYKRNPMVPPNPTPPLSLLLCWTMSSNQSVPHSNPGNVTSVLSLCSKVTLDGTNYNDWIRNIKMALRFEHKEYVLETELVEVDPDTATPEEVAAYTKHSDDATKVACIMIATMNPELQRIYEDYWPYKMHKELTKKFRKQERIKRREVVKAFTNDKPKDGESICTHVQRMHVHTAELHRMLRTTEDGMKGKGLLPVNPLVLAIGFGRGKKRKGPPKQNWREKTHVRSSSNAPRAKSSGIPHVQNPKEADCFYCKQKGHWKRSCPTYLQDIKDSKVKPSQAAIDASSGIEKACLWHCRLGHINKKRIAQLQKDGVLESFDLGSDDNKSDTFEKFKEFKNEAEKQLGRKIKMLRSDRGGEYLSIEFLDYLKECGIVSQLSPPRTPQLNGVAERRN
ncbi:hypothetical protein L2E82_40840 [Cichorium intybus]|uniref:Uncharacterized protein n=1 Tax=Cichorium intybus TaxID=13427 RepID=A0ACB9ALE3_CICIN|nr:hypothetical protein L2E82_40840 [Cichorium intybus]